MIDSDNWLIVGKVVAAHGLLGEVRINPSSEFAERFTKPGKRWLQTEINQIREINLISGRQMPGKNLFVVRFEGIKNRKQAELLIGNNLLVPSSDRPTLAANEFHLLDLLGLEARLDPEGPAIGHVTNLSNAGNDLLQVKLIEGKDVLVPFVFEIVPEVKIQEGWLLITPPPGLLDL